MLYRYFYGVPIRKYPKYSLEWSPDQYVIGSFVPCSSKTSSNPVPRLSGPRQTFVGWYPEAHAYACRHATFSIRTPSSICICSMQYRERQGRFRHPSPVYRMSHSFSVSLSLSLFHLCCCCSSSQGGHYKTKLARSSSSVDRGCSLSQLIARARS